MGWVYRIRGHPLAQGVAAFRDAATPPTFPGMAHTVFRTPFARTPKGARPQGMARAPGTARREARHARRMVDLWNKRAQAGRPVSFYPTVKTALFAGTVILEGFVPLARRSERRPADVGHSSRCVSLVRDPAALLSPMLSQSALCEVGGPEVTSRELARLGRRRESHPRQALALDQRYR
jgi:hypothetical protein